MKYALLIIAVLGMSACESTQRDVSDLLHKGAYNHGRKAGR
jgi:hypothetical protein